MQINLQYRGEKQTAQGKRQAMYYADLSYSHELFDGSLVLNGAIKDVFNTRKFEYLIDNKEFYKTIEYQHRGTQYIFGLKYFFNKKKSRGKKGGKRPDHGSGGSMF